MIVGQSRERSTNSNSLVAWLHHFEQNDPSTRLEKPLKNQSHNNQSRSVQTNHATRRPLSSNLRSLINRDQFVIEENPKRESSFKFPFATHLVTGYHHEDERELLRQEKLLREQLARDFQLMGRDELQLVDSSYNLYCGNQQQLAADSKQQEASTSTRGQQQELTTSPSNQPQRKLIYRDATTDQTSELDRQQHESTAGPSKTNLNRLISELTSAVLTETTTTVDNKRALEQQTTRDKQQNKKPEKLSLSVIMDVEGKCQLSHVARNIEHE